MKDDFRESEQQQVLPDVSRREDAFPGALRAPVSRRTAPAPRLSLAVATEPHGAGAIPTHSATAPGLRSTAPIPPRVRSAILPATASSEIAALLPLHAEGVHTFGFSAPAAMATRSGATWISPLLQHSVEFPSLWIRGPREARHVSSRARVRGLLDRLCGLDESRNPPKTAVIVAHPDDEAIGAGARLRALPDAMIIHITDGAPRDPAYALRKGFPSREAYAKSRQDELSAALAMLGVPRERTHCLDIVDGEAADRLVEITYRLADLLDRLRPEVAVTHPYEGGHTDHDATAFAVQLACGVLRREGAPSPIVLELTSYHMYEGSRRLGEFLPFPELEERTVALEPGTQHLKQEMYDCFASQQQCLAPFPRDREKFRVAPRYLFTEPPHAGRLLYEHVSPDFNGARWRDSARQALERLRSRRRCGQGR
ncbi:MAG TPA: PIG-L family deacetylase [Gemmatimonadaceae bacterium]|nr:PIG-L family deacetylase [Gemmatimonadaceae bacterium]